MAVQPCLGYIIAECICFTLVNDLKVIIQAKQSRAFAYNIVGQPVQRAHTVANIGQQASAFDEAADALVEVVYG